VEYPGTLTCLLLQMDIFPRLTGEDPNPVLGTPNDNWSLPRHFSLFSSNQNATSGIGL
jgi:hypothetical protein